MHFTKLPAPLVSLLLPALAASVHAATIFSDDFSGGTGDINGLAPDVTTGATWVASNQFNADGTILDTATAAATRGGSATLAFTPANGLIYTLDARFSGVTGNANWLALGFVFGQSTAVHADNRFTGDTIDATVGTTGKAWMLYRGTSGVSPNTQQSLLGSGIVGTTSAANYSTDFPNPDVSSGSTIDLRVVLDTTLGTGNWTATWYAKRPADGSYFTVRSTADVLDESINAVGIAKSNNGTTGTIESFSMTSVPEPSSAILGLLGTVALLLRRKSR